MGSTAATFFLSAYVLVYGAICFTTLSWLNPFTIWEGRLALSICFIVLLLAWAIEINE